MGYALGTGQFEGLIFDETNKEAVLADKSLKGNDIKRVGILV